MHETQTIGDELGEDGTHTSSGSTLVADVSDHISGVEDAVGHMLRTTTATLALSPPVAFSSADGETDDPAPTIMRPQSSRPPAFAAADESNDMWKAHGPVSDDELWDQVDNNIDNRVEVVSPDANQPAPLFSAVAALRPPPAETPSEASLRASPHYPEVVEKLRNVFHLKAFRKNQLAAIISTLDGRDAIVLMPTGGGKSLCFQLPAVCRGGKTTGVTVVVSPLRALMADQVERLRNLNIDVMNLASRDSQDGNTMHELRSAQKKPSLVYVTPEKLCSSDDMKTTLKGLHARRQIARFVIDEAHLINTWGRDFRSVGVRRLILDILPQANGALSMLHFMIFETSTRAFLSSLLLQLQHPKLCRTSLLPLV
jgi:DEAD/DEAH box helicase